MIAKQALFYSVKIGFDHSVICITVMDVLQKLPADDRLDCDTVTANLQKKQHELIFDIQCTENMSIHELHLHAVMEDADMPLTRNIFKKDIRRLSNTDDKRNQIRWF